MIEEIECSGEDKIIERMLKVIMPNTMDTFLHIIATRPIILEFIIKKL